MGMDCEIPTCGIFPPSAKEIPGESRAPSLEMSWNEAFEQYSSVVTNWEDAYKEYRRFVDCGYIIDLDDSTVERDFPSGHLSPVGVIIKLKRDGSTKVRIVVDMSKSLANGRSRVPERPVLPRPLDPAWDAVTGLRAGAQVEQATADLADAFPHLFVKEGELHNNLVARPPSSSNEASGPRSGRPKVGVLCKLGFGSTGGPLVWGRVSAAMGRLGQATLRPCSSGLRSRLRIYLDDPIFTLFGTPQRRRRELASILLLWSAAGFRISWKKGEIGNGLSWIGVDYLINAEAATITLKVPEKAVQEALSLASKLLEKPMGATRLLRKLAGKGSWIFSIAPRTRWTVQRLWAVVAAAAREGTTRSKSGRGGGSRFGLFARSQALLPLKWILAYWGSSSAHYSGPSELFSPRRRLRWWSTRRRGDLADTSSIYSQAQFSSSSPRLSTKTTFAASERKSAAPMANKPGSA